MQPAMPAFKDKRAITIAPAGATPFADSSRDALAINGIVCSSSGALFRTAGLRSQALIFDRVNNV